MHLLIIGATGRTGRLVTEQAIERGHSVTALVRTPSHGLSGNIRIVLGDPRRKDDLLAVLPGHEAVISCLGHRPGGDPWLVKEAAETMLAAMKKLEMRRYLVISGALLFRSYNPVILLMQRMLADRLADARATEKAVTAADIDWTIVRPPHLRDGNHKRGYRTKAGVRPSRSWSGLQFTDLADCLLDIAEGGSYIRQIVGVASASNTGKATSHG